MSCCRYYNLLQNKYLKVKGILLCTIESIACDVEALLYIDTILLFSSNLIQVYNIAFFMESLRKSVTVASDCKTV